MSAQDPREIVTFGVVWRGEMTAQHYALAAYIVQPDEDRYGDCKYDSYVFRYQGDQPVEYIGCDGGEPEDQTLGRDWSWVAPALNAAYALGRGAQ